MAHDISLMLQTTYAELLDRVSTKAFASAFPEDGSFTPKVQNGRRYWYFQHGTAAGRAQKYVGPETPELLARIRTHSAGRASERDQRSLVATLVRSGNLPRPLPPVGDAISALAEAGIFRLRGVLVGTIAYQTYSAMLGVRLPSALVQTNDIDLAQFAEISAAVGDTVPPLIEILRTVDPSFGAVPNTTPGRVVAYAAASGLRIDFLTPNRGRDTEEPRALPAFGTDAQPLRFLDFLIRDPEPAVLLHGAGVLVSVPSPQRFALHKLIVARRRRIGDPKRNKDVLQAQSLLDILAERRPYELQATWREAFGRGRNWQRLLGEGLGLLHPASRDRTLRVVGSPRSIVPGLHVVFVPDRVGYDAKSDQAVFFAKAGLVGLRCVVFRDVLVSCFGPRPNDPADCVRIVRQNREHLERAVRHRYATQPVESDHEVVVTLADIEATALPP